MPAFALPSCKLRAAAEAPCPRRSISSRHCPAVVLVRPGDILPWAAQPAWRHSGQVSTALQEVALLSQTHLVRGKVPLRLQMGPSQALAWDEPARTKNRAVLGEQPRSRKGHQQPERGRAGTLCPPGLSSPCGRVPPSVTSQNVLACCWLPKTLCSLSGTIRPSVPPAQAHPSPCASRRSQRQVQGSHSHLCLCLHQPLQAPGAQCPPLGRREGGEEGEQPWLCCSAAGAVLGDRAQSRETLTAWRRLSSLSRSLMDVRWVTRAPLRPSGVLCTGKGEAESWVSPKPSLVSCQAAVPESCSQPRGHLPQLGAVFPRPSSFSWSIPPAYPSSVATHSSFSAWDLQIERRESVRPCCPQPWAKVGACTALCCGAGQRRCPSPGSLCPA